jgi:hypothetical protein
MRFSAPTLFALALSGIAPGASAATLTAPPCTLGTGQTTCTTTVSWALTEAAYGCVWLDTNVLFACGGQTGSAPWPWTTTAGTTFILRGHQGPNPQSTAPELARKSVQAIPSTPPPPAGLNIPATYGYATSYYPFYNGQYRATYAYGGGTDPNGALYGVNAHYFGRKIPGMVDTWQMYWPHVLTDDNLDPRNTNVEEFSVKRGCLNGTSWVWFNRYKSFTNSTSAVVTNVQTLKATYTHNGQSFDITNVCGNNLSGQPYLPLNVPAGAYRMQVWGNVISPSGLTPFYWDSKFEYQPSVVNTSWEQDKAKTRSGLRFEESWWTPGGWSLGSGQTGSVPGLVGVWATGFGDGADGQNLRPRWGVQAQGAGYFWNYHIPSVDGGKIARSKRFEPYSPAIWPTP